MSASGEVPGAAAESVLLSEGVFTAPSRVRRQILGCIACQWNQSIENDEHPEYSNIQLRSCVDTSYDVVSRLSRVLAAHDVVRKLDYPFGRVSRGYGQGLDSYHYTVVDSDTGIAFQEALEPHTPCRAEQSTTD